MINKLKLLKERIFTLINFGYWNPKYVYLASSLSAEDEKLKNILWQGAGQYLNRGDGIFDELYLAINDLKALKKIYVEKEEK